MKPVQEAQGNNNDTINQDDLSIDTTTTTTTTSPPPPPPPSPQPTTTTATTTELMQDDKPSGIAQTIPDEKSLNSLITVATSGHQQQQELHNEDGGVGENNITRDEDPRPAVFIARKLFSDFVLLVNRKVETILAQETRDKPIYKSLHRHEDRIYDRILEALGAISEYCLPSLLKALLTWYHHQLGADDPSQKKPPPPASSSEAGQQHSQSHSSNCDYQPPLDCGSPCGNDTITSNYSLLRSPTPSSPEITSNQISIVSTLPLDYQSPSLTVIGEAAPSSSAANTSTSTATNVSSQSIGEESSTNTIKRLELAKTRNLLIEYTFCQLLIEMFNQLYLHPGNEDLIGQIEEIAFEHFKYIEPNELSPSDLANVNQLADKYAEMIGVLAQTRFKSVKKRFMSELYDLRSKEPTPYNIQCIVSLLSGFKFFRVKMAPIEEFEASMQFLQECAEYFLEVRHKSIRHALAGLFVEIMVPLASIVKNEVKIPCLKNFVETLWAQTLDMCARKKHSITLFPLVTCLLCVSQRSIFLTNWPSFLNMCLSNLKNRDQKMCRVALESLYRLIWIYMIRVKCESNNVTQTRLQSIVDALFPRGSRAVVPRDAPVNIFVDIIHFIAQERLDFAMRHIIFELLSVDRPFKVISAPERMNIALQAFLVIVDSLQSKEGGDPAMPKSVGILASYNTTDGNYKTNSNSNTMNSNINANNSGYNTRPVTSSRGFRAQSANNRMLNDDIAKAIGIYPYYPHVQRSFNDILRALDSQFGRPLLLTTTQNSNKELDDVITSERKPKIELFKICLTAIPRLMPEGYSKTDLIDLLARMTVHVDEDMRKNAFSSLRILITDFADWRMDVIEGYVSFLVNQIDESLRHLQDNAFKMLLQLLISWRSAITLNGNGCGSDANGPDSSQPINGGAGRSCPVSIQTGYETISVRSGGTGGQIAARKNRALAEMRLIQSELSNIRFDKLVTVMQKVEGPSLIMLCSCHQPTRKLAGELLRETRSILRCYSIWTCMEQLSFKSPDELAANDDDEDDLSTSFRGSMSVDNLSRITATSANNPAFSSVTSMNIQAVSSSSVGKMHNQQHDPYDSDIETDLTDCFGSATNHHLHNHQQQQQRRQSEQEEDNTPAMFWVAVIMLDNNENEQEYTFALRLIRRFLPMLPFDQVKFLEQVDRNLKQIKWEQFPGLHELVLRGCSSQTNYDLTIALLDHMTPNLKHPLCNAPTKLENQIFPIHVIVLLTQLLSNYDDPTPFSLNIARRIAIWCDENAGQKLENLSTVMTLFARRCFSKDAFQWTKCVIKYLYDAYADTLHTVIPLLVDMLESGPDRVQRLVAPILYCILNYVDISSPLPPSNMNIHLCRLYTKHLQSGVTKSTSGQQQLQWREAVQIFKLIISRSSQLATQSGSHARELPGRTMDFTVDVESISVPVAAIMGEECEQEVDAIAAAAAAAEGLAAEESGSEEVGGPGGVGGGGGQNSASFNLSAATSLLIPKFINRKSLRSTDSSPSAMVSSSGGGGGTSSSNNNSNNNNNNKD